MTFSGSCHRNPVLAAPDSRIYRVTRFVARNRLIVAATTCVSLALVFATVMACLAARNANRSARLERQTSEQLRQQQARIVQSSEQARLAFAQTKQQLYASLISQAGNAFTRNEFYRMSPILQRCPSG